MAAAFLRSSIGTSVFRSQGTGDIWVGNVSSHVCVHRIDDDHLGLITFKNALHQD